jgi:hypothetical protein
MLRRFQFRLVTMFAAVSMVACVLAVLQNWYLVPIRTGTISHAICYTKDFEQLIGSRSGHTAGDFTMYNFPAAAAAELFRDFPTRPQLWPDEKEIPGFRGYDRRTTTIGFPWGFYRNRPINDPVGVCERALDQRYAANDSFCVGGAFGETAIPPKRYFIDGVFQLTLDMQDTGPAKTTIADMVEYARLGQSPPPTGHTITSRLRYVGPPPSGLLVFSLPIDDELVQLIILDLR